VSTAAFSGSRIATERRRLRLSVELLVERRVGIYVALDLVALLIILVSALASNKLSGLYIGTVLPLLLPGVLVLSDAVALERRAGSLDLALSTPGARFYFEKRVGAFAGMLALQSSLILILLRLVAGSFPILPALIQIATTSLLVGAISLFWTVSLKSGDAAALASTLSILALGRWFFASPIPDVAPPGLWLGFEGSLDWARVNAAILLAAAVFYAYARRRIAVPEKLLG